MQRFSIKKVLLQEITMLLRNHRRCKGNKYITHTLEMGKTTPISLPVHKGAC